MKHTQKHHSKSQAKSTGAACPYCGPDVSYVVIKGTEICNRCKRPLPSNTRRFTAFAWVTMPCRIAA